MTSRLEKNQKRAMARRGNSMIRVRYSRAMAPRVTMPFMSRTLNISPVFCFRRWELYSPRM